MLIVLYQAASHSWSNMLQPFPNTAMWRQRGHPFCTVLSVGGLACCRACQRVTGLLLTWFKVFHKCMFSQLAQSHVATTLHAKTSHLMLYVFTLRSHRGETAVRAATRRQKKLLIHGFQRRQKHVGAHPPWGGKRTRNSLLECLHILVSNQVTHRAPKVEDGPA